MRKRLITLALCALLIAACQAHAQRSRRADDPYAKSNVQLEKWVKEIGDIDVKIEGPVFEGGPKIKGLKAIYQGFFKKGDTDWRIRRYAVPKYGDVLDLSRQKGREFDVEESVTCPKEGIRREDIKKLLRKLVE